jgi:hypothetical protein
MTSRNTFFYEEKATLTGSYKDNAFDFKFASRHLKMSVVGGDVAFVLTGADDTKKDGLIKPSDGLVPFDGLEASRIAVKQVSGTVTQFRIWAYK